MPRRVQVAGVDYGPGCGLRSDGGLDGIAEYHRAARDELGREFSRLYSSQDGVASCIQERRRLVQRDPAIGRPFFLRSSHGDTFPSCDKSCSVAVHKTSYTIVTCQVSGNYTAGMATVSPSDSPELRLEFALARYAQGDRGAQARLAARIGESKANVSRWFAGLSRPRERDKLQLIADACGVDVGWLDWGSASQAPEPVGYRQWLEARALAAGFIAIALMAWAKSQQRPSLIEYLDEMLRDDRPRSS